MAFHPAITINDFTYRGDINFADIREAICAAYLERPAHCNLEEIWKQKSAERPYEGKPADFSSEKGPSGGKREVNPVRAWHVVASIFFILLI